MEDENRKFPYEIKELKPEEKAEITRLFQCTDIDYVSVGPKGYKLLRPYCEDAENIYNMPLLTSDIFVATYQRSGTTWTQELVWLIANNLDYATAKSESLTQRYQFLEGFMYYKTEEMIAEVLQNSHDKEAVQVFIDNVCTPATANLLTTPSPRFIKTHLPLSLLPPKLLDIAKVVYVARDPRDVAVSSYHCSRFFKKLYSSTSFKGFWNLFTSNLFTFTPVFEHIKEAWKMRNHPNMLFLFYEELKKDMPAVVRRVTDFLGKRITEEQITRLCDHLSIENFKKNDSVNFSEFQKFGFMSSNENFIRQGNVGGWRDYFDEKMTQQAERWIADNLRDTDMRFPSFQ